ncbi:unnamed protein product [Pleuronectes platessa]|uniref:Uncharacterized protein n=1 Tax=Pleuronectes platessa TaxID=8262 RepID=A0A9N7V3D8_PLEPL|nr:unnamed protein product [Pleuronectes platessa]
MQPLGAAHPHLLIRLYPRLTRLQPLTGTRARPGKRYHRDELQPSCRLFVKGLSPGDVWLQGPGCCQSLGKSRPFLGRIWIGPLQCEAKVMAAPSMSAPVISLFSCHRVRGRPDPALAAATRHSDCLSACRSASLRH